jgi:hypothetical protein
MVAQGFGVAVKQLPKLLRRQESSGAKLHDDGVHEIARSALTLAHRCCDREEPIALLSHLLLPSRSLCPTWEITCLAWGLVWGLAGLAWGLVWELMGPAWGTALDAPAKEVELPITLREREGTSAEVALHLRPIAGEEVDRPARRSG